MLSRPAISLALIRILNMILDSMLTKRFLELLERIFQNERPYRFKHGIKRQDGLSNCQEITIAKINVQKLADYCLINQSTYHLER